MSFSYRRSLLSSAVLAVLVAPTVALATNGMNLEGYGPEATGMGGASMAYDNGSAAAMNNPATLSLMSDGESRLDLTVGLLRPTVSASAAGAPQADSSGTSYLMPGAGWVTKQGQLSYGVALYSQGGMGTEYAKDSFLAAGTGEAVRSEVGVGRLMAPLSFEVNHQLSVGGSLDFVWAGMDLKMAMSGQQFGDFMPGAANNAGTASGGLVNSLGGAIQAGNLNPLNPVQNVRFDFSNDSDFSGEAMGTGFGAKLGLTFKASSGLTFGATFHTKTNMSDLDTNNASLTMNANFDNNLLAQTWNGVPVGAPGNAGAPAGTYTTVNVPVSGKISVVDFQWPATLGVGAALKLSPAVMLAADIKQIYWSGVMDSFRMQFTSDAAQANPLAAGFANQTMDLEMFQKWDDQTVVQLGGAFKMGAALTVRAGVNIASNPVPNSTLNPLFPAIIENHYTAGFTLALTPASDLSASMAIAPDVTAVGDSGVTSKHAQANFQVMYSHSL
ncbi:MAG: outer membrane protein transport protein [Gammaproteobacteria bacterium]|nr:outer membrane protein transport protein [Gammaproteobacteria bacterium]